MGAVANRHKEVTGAQHLLDVRRGPDQRILQAHLDVPPAAFTLRPDLGISPASSSTVR